MFQYIGYVKKGGRFEESMKFDLSEISDGFSKDETILDLMTLYKPAGFIDRYSICNFGI